MIFFRKTSKEICVYLILLYSLIAIPSISLASFSISNKPINPACLNMINGSLADMPFIYELNMDRCQSSNAAFAGNNGTTGFTTGKNPATQCRYSYKVIGKSTNGIYVISTTNSCGGGSGVFTDLILTKLIKKQRYIYDSKTNQLNKKTYSALMYVADLGGGDRASGSFYDLKVVGNKLIGKRHNSDATPVGKSRKKGQKVEIDFSGID